MKACDLLGQSAMWRENPSDPNREHDWLYRYDGLHRLQSADRGQLNTAHSAIQTLDLAQCWTLDPTGNWSHYRQDDNGNGTWDLIQDRTANTVNEITDIDNLSGTPWATPAYDKNGNSTSIPRPDLGSGALMTATYDAWNRMTKLVDSSTSNTLLENEFDGRNFRIVAKQYSGGTLSDTRHYYFTDNWQCVEERLGSATTPERQHVWGLRYIDDLIVRDRDTNADGTLDERLYHCADANWNTVAVVGSDRSVAERYEYDPYGQLSFFAADYTAKTTSSYDTRYTYTNREWTPEAALYYFRNRWYNSQLGRFCSRDPIGYRGSAFLLSEFVGDSPINRLDPFGLKECKITLFGGHNYSILNTINENYPGAGNLNTGDPWEIPEGECIVGIGCGTGVDVDGDGASDSIQDYLNEHYPCNSILAPNLCEFDDPAVGLRAEIACRALRYAYEQARRAAQRMIEGRPANPAGSGCEFDCDVVEIKIVCDADMRNLADNGIWRGRRVGRRITRSCAGLCGASREIPGPGLR